MPPTKLTPRTIAAISAGGFDGRGPAHETIQGPRSRTILLVDDEPNILKLFGMMLNRRGYDVMTASDGLEAIEVFMRNRPDLVIADINMPKMNGIEMLMGIRTAVPEAKAIMMSGDITAEKAALLRQTGVSGIFQKPLDPRLLLSCVDKLMLEKKATALVADGAPGVAKLVARILKEDADSIITVDGIEALDVIRSCSLDIIILGIELERLSGVDVMESAKKEIPGAKVIMMSGAPSDGHMWRIQNAGCGFINKPFMPEELRSMVLDMLASLDTL